MTHSETERATTEPLGGDDADDPFGDIQSKILQAIDEEVAERRRRGLPIVVERSNGVEILPS